MIGSEGTLLEVLHNLLLLEVVNPLPLLILELLDPVLKLLQVEPALRYPALVHLHQHHVVEAGVAIDPSTVGVVVVWLRR